LRFGIYFRLDVESAIGISKPDKKYTFLKHLNKKFSQYRDWIQGKTHRNRKYETFTLNNIN